MGRLKKMSLKKALFTLVLLDFIIVAVLTVVTLTLRTELQFEIAPRGIALQYTADGEKIALVEKLPQPDEGSLLLSQIFEIGSYVLIFFYFCVCTTIAVTVFYRVKIKKPLEQLRYGEARIIANDLDFRIQSESEDELGRLCDAFETMRVSLRDTNRELWRQNEERKRLNAAFSHDLRNPVTVLKGSAKMARQSVERGDVNRETLIRSLERIEKHSARIENYVEIMSSVQRLEQIPLQSKYIASDEISSALDETVHLMGAGSGKEIRFTSELAADSVKIDRGMLFIIAENLVSNALRFAENSVSVSFSTGAKEVRLTVEDDGNGFPEKMIKNGIKPFQKGTEEAGHFGMGLYICMLLSRRHGGGLTIENIKNGAKVSAVLK